MDENNKDEQKSLPKNLLDKLKSTKGMLSTVSLFLAAFFAALLLNAFVFQPYEVEGTSMEPTLQNGDRLVVFKLGKTWSNIIGSDFVPKRGEIIVFERRDVSGAQLIKRVIGLPGERVVIDNGQITVFNAEFPNGFNPDPAFEADLATTFGSDIDVTIGAREIFVVGDNRIQGGSLDSRSSLGNVSVDDIIGTLVLRIFPINNLDAY